MTLTIDDFHFVRGLVQRASAIVLHDDKAYLAESRLLIVARRQGFASVTELVSKLRAEPRHGLHKYVVEAMTTNETSFFRDGQPFEALRTLVVPEAMKQAQASRTLNIWSAAASTGQEAYTIAMTLSEHFPQFNSWKVQILGTDLSTEVLEKARAGKYGQIEINRGLPARLLVKYFEQKGMHWEAKPNIRKMVDFRQMNLIEPWPMLPTMDIVFLRNVLIYFDVETKKKILASVRKVLRPGGFLFLGGAETTMNLDEHFERVNFDRSGCYRFSKI